MGEPSGVGALVVVTHATKLQLLVCTSLPGHALPVPTADVTTRRERVCVPLPQLTEHELQPLSSDVTQSTGQSLSEQLATSSRLGQT
jgi:hypothetical protein